MIQLLFASKVSKAFSATELRELLGQLRAQNEATEVTGMLIYHQGRFLHVIEGPDEAVWGAYSNLSSDPSHTDVQVIDRRQINERDFGNWPMGFADSSEIPPNVQGYSDIQAAFAELTDGRAYKALTWFQQGFWHSVAA